MADSMLTLADVAAINSSEEIVGVIEENAKVFPEISVISASPVSKTSYNTLVQTALPAVGFRDINTGLDYGTPTLVSRLVECKFLDASWVMDQAAADGVDWGRSAAFAMALNAHMKAALKAVADQTWYGVSADANGFVGAASLFPDLNADMLVNAGGTTASTGSSVFAIRTGIDAVQYALGNDGQIAEGEIQQTLKEDPTGKSFVSYFQPVKGWIGLQISNHTAVGRIANLTEDPGATLTDDMIYELLSQFKVGEGPSALFMSRRSLEQLRKSRTATNATGAPAPVPTEVESVPIFPTESIVNTEDLLT